MLRTQSLFMVMALIAILAIVSSRSAAQSGSPPVIDATPIDVRGEITAVTAYRGRAAVTRRATIELHPGVYDLRFTRLPESIQPQSLQARARGDVNVIGVEFLQSPQIESDSTALAALDAKIKELRAAIARTDEQHAINNAQGKLLDEIAARISGDAAKNIGAELDLDALRSQIGFLAEQREAIMDRRLELDQQKADLEAQLRIAERERQAVAGDGNIARSAVVSVICTESAATTVEITYLVNNATWEPVYNIRASLDGTGTQIEYDAMLTQRTGEDWENVKLTLSTAQPTIAANPPTLRPWFVDIQRPRDPVPLARAAPPSPAEEEMAFPYQRSRLNSMELKDLAADAEVAGEGSSVSFEIPRAVTVKTDLQRQQRTRIATINANPRFTHVAIPLLTEAVYIRGDLTNASAYQLLPGRASVFVNQDYVGPTAIPNVAPNGEFELHFGIDHAVKAARQLVTKKTESTGLLGGGRRTSYEYRIVLDNGTGKPIALELWDRYPTSRTDEIQIELTDVSHPLAKDAKYLAEERPQGLLKWVIAVPANASGSNALALTYGLRVNRAKDVEMTPLPE